MSPAKVASALSHEAIKRNATTYLYAPTPTTYLISHNQDDQNGRLILIASPTGKLTFPEYRPA